MTVPPIDKGLLDKIAQRDPGICLYGFAPPKRSTAPDQLAQIAHQQVERLAHLDIDGVIIYDIREETERTAEPRPFPFLPTIPPEEYASAHLAALTRPKVIYRCVTGDTRESFEAWLSGVRHSRAITVLVGAPSRNAVVGLSLRDAYALVERHAPELTLGGIAIAERHAHAFDEHQRILAKAEAGCRFFVTQAVYDVTSTLSLLSDYALALDAASRPPAPIILTFSPCGSLKTLEFMKWLGISFPRWLENELRFARDPLETSLELCERIFLEVWTFARNKGLPLGVNIESVSIRKTEIEAASQLVRTLRTHMQRSLAQP
jgi:5,10-methylenetetrahydrofolate reductase